MTLIVLRILVDVDLDGVRRVAVLDAAVPASLDDHVAVLDRRPDELDVDRVRVQRARLRHDDGRVAEERVVARNRREREDDAVAGVARLAAAAGVATGAATGRPSRPRRARPSGSPGVRVPPGSASAQRPRCTRR